MRLTARDHQVLRDIALSHVLTRDQLIGLGYFSSITRANTRLRTLRRAGFLKQIETPFFGQALHMAGSKAGLLVGEVIGKLLVGRSGSPRFVQHALATTNVRIALVRKSGGVWRFEQQAHSVFEFAGNQFEVRPDGLLLTDGATLVEVDLGHVSAAKFKQKLKAFEAFLLSGECQRQWQQASFDVMVITTGPRRAASLLRLLPKGSHFALHTTTFNRLGLPAIGGWS